MFDWPIWLVQMMYANIAWLWWRVGPIVHRSPKFSRVIRTEEDLLLSRQMNQSSFSIAI